MGTVIVVVMLLILGVISFRLNRQLVGWRRRLGQRGPVELTMGQQIAISQLRHDRRKWVLLSQVLFVITVIMIFSASFTELCFFLDLYTVASIVVRQSNIQEAKLIAHGN
ncbi:MULTISPECIES: hypothetical protein [unclassified Ligilactobacillus]|uniref:hypothetical protein n=1 Tax=unclassified Ligilactobacillus TaxID=2767920 RepID=UPI003852B8FE